MKDDIERYVCGYSKVPDAEGEFHMIVEYRLNPVNLDELRSCFDIATNENDIAARDVLRPFKIENHQVKFIQSKLKNENIDLEKYDFYLECFQKSDH